MEANKEVWKDVKNYEGLYVMSTHGRLKSFHWNPEGRLLKYKLNKNGYWSYVISKDNFQKSMLAHKLMWETFVGEIPAGYSVDHCNSKRECNFIENLQLLTHAEQVHKEQTDLIRAEHTSGQVYEGWGGRSLEQLTGISRSWIKILYDSGKSCRGWKFTVIKKHTK
jgi:hypothetical protein